MNGQSELQKIIGRHKLHLMFEILLTSVIQNEDKLTTQQFFSFAKLFTCNFLEKDKIAVLYNIKQTILNSSETC